MDVSLLSGDTMNEKYALKMIDEFIFCIQKFRSNAIEGLSKRECELLPGMYPWTMGAKCPLCALMRVSDRGAITKHEYFNFMVILHRFMPEVLLFAAVTGAELNNTRADVSILTEWQDR